jgi:esterase/lipase
MNIIDLVVEDFFKFLALAGFSAAFLFLRMNIRLTIESVALQASCDDKDKRIESLLSKRKSIEQEQEKAIENVKKEHKDALDSLIQENERLKEEISHTSDPIEVPDAYSAFR